MSPSLPVPSSPRLSAPLCCHTLADLRFLLHHLAPRRLTPRTVGLLLRIAAAPDGVERATLRKTEIRRLQLRWRCLVYRDGEQMRAREGLCADLGVRDAAQAASVGRVFRALVKSGLKTWEIGTLIYASQPGGIMRKDLIASGWTMDLKNRVQKVSSLLDLRLIRFELRPMTGLRGTIPRRFIHLTAAGEKLLLGQWGKAVEKRRGDEGTGRLGETEGRMAA